MAQPSQSNEILTHQQIQRLLERNNENPELGRPVYISWSGPVTLRPGNPEVSSATTFTGTHQRWEQALDSRTWYIQHKGKRDEVLVTKAIRSKATWIEVPINAKRT